MKPNDEGVKLKKKISQKKIKKTKKIVIKK
jgi:hypothetical protein